MFETKNANGLSETGNYFDFGSFDENYIPKYKDLLDESNNPSGKIPKNVINQFKKYEGYVDIDEINKNDIVNGKIIEINKNYVVVDIGYKDNILINRRGQEDRVCKHLQVDQMVDVMITDISNNPYIIRGSISELIKMNVDSKMKDFYKNNVSINATVIDTIPAGYNLLIEIDGITIDAFMPNTLADVNKISDVNSLVGKNIKVMLETLQQDKGVYVVSRRKYLKTLIPDKVKEIKNNPKDKVYTGHVTGTRDFGVFVQFEDCLTGMIHKANIREDYQDKIKSIEPGTLIDFYVKDITKGGNQIILTQILKESLWDTIRVGDIIKGKVISVKPFGALIELDYETNGLIQTTYINKNNRKLIAGEIVDVIVISIIRDDRKIYLTFKDDDDMINKLKEKSDELEKLKQKFNDN